jgi:glycosyltransferase involved in cell wall biosynthesis
MSIQISIIVPTYKRIDLLKSCLTALLAQDFDPAAYEIIVVDDAGCDATQQLIASLSACDQTSRRKPDVRYLRLIDAHGPAAARNLGWRAARGAIIAFTDDDCLPAASWLRAGLAAFEDGVAAVSGRIVVPLPSRPTDYEHNVGWLANAEFATANCFCRREVLAALGGFDERFTAAWREDSDLHFTLLERACSIAHAPTAIVTHPVRPGGWGISIKQQRKSMFNALLYKKHPQLYRHRIQPAPPGRYYCIVGALLGALAGIAQRRRWLGMSGVIAWALLTGRFCARRLQGTSHAPSHLAEMIVTSALIPPLAIFWRLCGALRYRVIFL